MIKRILTVVLGICIMAQNVAFASSYADIPEGANYGTAVEVLTSLNILTKSATDIEFRPDDGMKRGEYIQQIIRLRGINPDMDATHDYIFSDVTEDTPYANAIYIAYDMGLISGYSDKTFAPDEVISGVEAIKILVSALGYNVSAENLGGYPVGYLSEASRLGLTDGIKISNVIEFKRSDAAQLLYNSLEADVMMLVSAGGEQKYAVTEGENVLTEYLKCGADEGIVKKTHYTTLTNAESTLPYDEVMIDDSVYKIGKTNIASLLGYKVKVYYKAENEYDDKVLVYVTPYKTDVVKIDSENISSYENYNLDYWVDIDSDQDTKRLVISNKADVIYNGKAYPDYQDEDIRIEECSITVIDNNSDDKFDVVLINKYDDYVVSSINTGDKIIYSRYPAQGKIDLSNVKDKDINVVDATGAHVDFNAIKPNDVLTVVMSKDGLLVDITVSTEQENAEINEILSESEAAIDYLPRKIAKSFQTDFAKLNIGYRGTFLIDARGKVAGILSQSSNLLEYGYLSRLAQQPGIGETIIARIFTVRGTMEDFTVAKNLLVDGKSLKALGFYNQFTLVNPISGARYLNPELQVIKYSLSEDKTLKFVDSVREDEGGNTEASLKGTHFQGTDGLGIKWKPATLSFSSSVITSKETTFFRVPVVDSTTPPEFSNTFDAKAFSTKVAMQDNELQIFDAYDIDDGGYSPLIVMKTSYSADDPIGGTDGDKPAADSVYVMVDKIASAINKDGEQVPKLYFMEKGSIIGVEVKNTNVIKKYDYQTDANGAIIYNKSTFEPEIDLNKPGKILKQGDIIRYKLNGDGVLVGTAIAYDSERTDANQFIMKSGDDAGKALGMVYSQKNGNVVISTTAIKVNDGYKFSISPNKFYVYPIGKAPVMIYDSKQGKLFKGSLGDIVDYKTDPGGETPDYENNTLPGNASIVFIHTKWYEMREVFIIK